ncbi:Replicative DNA helicase [BD1-7 clade bacterium]|uniref:Replicative DNA helicase n=1 Tax=BD1-7 clade bacterium TaxID=2029982 RepID=A0A5S9N219_9GAMM|nr:Replicative DNA helicase [BD1-7 clade bacterium]
MENAEPLSPPSQFEEELDLQTLLPPHSMEAEQAVIGGLLIANDRWDDVADLITSEDFYRKEHRQLFQAMVSLVESEHPIDVVTLADRLQTHDALESTGGLAYLAELAHNTPSAANIRAYAKVVQEKSVSRKLLLLSNHIDDITRNPEGRAADDIIAETERELNAITENRANDGGPRSVNPILKNTVENIENLVANQGMLSGLSSGFADLDKLTNGLHKTDLIIVAARPAMGKTTFAMNLVEAAIFKNDPPKPAIVFSMEMSGEQLMLRLLSAAGRIDQGDIKRGNLQDDDWPKLSAAVQKLKDKPLYIDDTPALTPTEVRSRTRRIARDHDGEIGLVMIDYLQLMTVSGRSEGRTAEISEISRSLKGLAKEFNCPVIALSQLNRSLEQRPNKRPVMSDLRESGAIEQDADIIMFIYRDEVYDEDSPAKGQAEIIIGKHRSGPTDTVRLAFIGRYTRFDNLAADAYQNEY